MSVDRHGRAGTNGWPATLVVSTVSEPAAFINPAAFSDSATLGLQQQPVEQQQRAAKPQSIATESAVEFVFGFFEHLPKRQPGSTHL